MSHVDDVIELVDRLIALEDHPPLSEVEYHYRRIRILHGLREYRKFWPLRPPAVGRPYSPGDVR